MTSKTLQRYSLYKHNNGCLTTIRKHYQKESTVHASVMAQQPKAAATESSTIKQARRLLVKITYIRFSYTHIYTTMNKLP